MATLNMSYTNKWQLNSKQTKRRNWKAQSTLNYRLIKNRPMFLRTSNQ